jgi:hypothetical protein
MSSTNLAYLATNGKLTVQEEVNAATKDKLKKDECAGHPLLLCASRYCPIEVIEAILDKGVNIINEFSQSVSMVVGTLVII